MMTRQKTRPKKDAGFMFPAETYSIQENGGQQYGGQQKYVSGIKQTHNGGGLERPVMEKKRSMIAFHEGN
ncbi:hypothetical protein NC652_036281 [Populus alba x Populus x berolinensis]|nr:hypothetical protein NC652_036281 [Populus alba x Populus x berolinensis]